VIFHELELPGVFAIEVEPFVDDRGSFARVFSTEEFAVHGLETHVEQRSLSTNRRRATLRGLHLQTAPHEEAKLIRCTRGAVFDVLVDLRRDSSALGRWIGVELRSDDARSLYAPAGVAHGFVTLENDTWLDYAMSVAYSPAAAAGIRWDDPAIGVDWPVSPEVISERDERWPSVDLDRIRVEGLEAALR
jgi:dTDP-4-dehydrorhamnose 3,5-epimerase